MTAPEFQNRELARRIEALESENYHLHCWLTDAHRDIGVLFDRVETLTNGRNGQGELPNVDPLYAATATDAARTEVCPRCNGAGGVANAGDCSTCDGDGLIHVPA